MYTNKEGGSKLEPQTGAISSLWASQALISPWHVADKKHPLSKLPWDGDCDFEGGGVELWSILFQGWVATHLTNVYLCYDVRLLGKMCQYISLPIILKGTWRNPICWGGNLIEQLQVWYSGKPGMKPAYMHYMMSLSSGLTGRNKKGSKTSGAQLH